MPKMRIAGRGHRRTHPAGVARVQTGNLRAGPYEVRWRRAGLREPQTLQSGGPRDGRDAEALPPLKHVQNGFVVSTADRGANRHRGPGRCKQPGFERTRRTDSHVRGNLEQRVNHGPGIGRLRRASASLPKRPKRSWSGADPPRRHESGPAPRKGLSWERGHLARPGRRPVMDDPPKAHDCSCGQDARAPRKRHLPALVWKFG